MEEIEQGSKVAQDGASMKSRRRFCCQVERKVVTSPSLCHEVSFSPVVVPFASTQRHLVSLLIVSLVGLQLCCCY